MSHLAGPRDVRPLVLCVLSKSPLPDDTGSRRRLLRLVTAAADVADVRVAIVSADVSTAELALLESQPWPLTVVTPAARRPSPRQLIRGAFRSGTPLRWLRLDAEGAARELAGAADQIQPDLVWFDGALLADAMAPAMTVPFAVDLAHSEREAIDSDLRSMVRSPRSSWKQAVLLALDRSARIRAEARALSRAALLTACSPLEARAAATVSRAPSLIIENGIDLDLDHASESFAPLPASRPRRLLFVGNMGYRPNVTAAGRLVDAILPALRADEPTLELEIAGPRCESIEHLGHAAGVTIHGFVPDLGPLYRRAALVIAPLSSGSGTKLKVLEAFGHGVPVVTTSVGVAGLACEPGHHVLVADTDAGLVAAARTLLGDQARAEAQRGAAAAWVRAHHSWASIGRRFAIGLADAAQQHRA